MTRTVRYLLLVSYKLNTRLEALKEQWRVRKTAVELQEVRQEVTEVFVKWLRA